MGIRIGLYIPKLRREKGQPSSSVVNSTFGDSPGECSTDGKTRGKSIRTRNSGNVTIGGHIIRLAIKYACKQGPVGDS